MRRMIDRTRTISITGRAIVKTISDITVVRAKVSGVAKTFDKALKELSKSTKDLKDAIERAGIDRDALKTTDLAVDRHFKKVKDGTDKYGDPKYKSVPDGFDYRQNISFEFPNDNGKLSAAVMNIIQCNVEPKIVFSYRSSRYEEAKNEALAKAVENARKEAEIIVKAAGAKLGKLLDVGKESYRDDREYDHNEMLCDACAYPDEIDFDVNPEDEIVSQNVEMTWEIEG